MRLLKRAAAAAVCAVIILNLSVMCMAAGYTTINITSSVGTRISYGGAELTRITGSYTRNGGTYSENAYVVTAKPGQFCKPDVINGASLYGRKTMTDQLSHASGSGGAHIAAAINSDFFSSQTGLPLGTVISGGYVRATNNHEYDVAEGHYTVGFRADGSSVVGIPDFSVRVSVNGREILPDRLNAYPDTNLVILTRAYGDKTYWNNSFAHNVVVLRINGDFTVGNTNNGSFVSYLRSVTEPVAIEDGCVYLIEPAGGTRLSSLAADAVTGDESSAGVYDNTGKWVGVTAASGGGDLLINDGVARYPSTYDSSIASILTSRSAIGIKSDGTVVFYTVERDSKGEISAGVWLESVTQSLLDMGCVYAVNLDGGGSAELCADTDGTGCRVINSCQDGYERRIADCFVLRIDEQPPAVIEDFEKGINVTERFSGTDVIDVTADGAGYTGNHSLDISYKLRGIGSIVGFDFNNPYDCTALSSITLTVNGNKSGSVLSAVIKTDSGITTRRVCKLDFSGYEHFEVDVSDASQLAGFNVDYVLASDNSGEFQIDRLVGCRGYSLYDDTPPAVTATVSNSKVTVTARDEPFGSGADAGSYAYAVEGNDNQVKRVSAEACDVYGNRARVVTLFTLPWYNEPMAYSDVPDGKWYSGYVRYSTERGIVNGFVENGVRNFRGNDAVTRLQYCIMLTRRRGLDISMYTGVTLPYEDADSIPRWALLYVKAAYAEGIMVGSKTVTGVSFLPNSMITRAEAAVSADRINVKDIRLKPAVTYNDFTSIAKWARDGVTSATAQGLINGDKGGSFSPKRSLSRYEAAAIMTRMNTL